MGVAEKKNLDNSLSMSKTKRDGPFDGMSLTVYPSEHETDTYKVTIKIGKIISRMFQSFPSHVMTKTLELGYNNSIRGMDYATLRQAAIACGGVPHYRGEDFDRRLTVVRFHRYLVISFVDRGSVV